MTGSKAKYHFGTIGWLDAHGTLEELTIDEAREGHHPTRIVTKGWVLVTDEVGVTYAAEWLPGEPETWRGVGFIPRGMIVSETTKKVRKTSGQGKLDRGSNEERGGAPPEHGHASGTEGPGSEGSGGGSGQDGEQGGETSTPRTNPQ